MGARSRDQRKTVRYWTKLVLKKLAEKANVDEADLLKTLKPILSQPAGLYISHVVAETVWIIVRDWSTSQLGAICCRGLGSRMNGRGGVISFTTRAGKSTKLEEFTKLEPLSLRMDGKTILRELARLVIIADMYDALKDAARYPQCECMEIGHIERGSPPLCHAKHCPVYKLTRIFDCGAGIGADP